MAEDKFSACETYRGIEVHPPEAFVWELIITFAEEFEGWFGDGCQKLLFPIELNYARSPDGLDRWYVLFLIRECERDEFYDFLKKFYKDRKLSFHDPRIEKK